MKRTLTDADRIASIREAIEAANGDWHEATALWSVCKDIEWLLSQVEAAAPRSLDTPEDAPDGAAERLRPVMARFFDRIDADYGFIDTTTVRAEIDTALSVAPRSLDAAWAALIDPDPMCRHEIGCVHCRALTAKLRERVALCGCRAETELGMAEGCALCGHRDHGRYGCREVLANTW